MTEAERTIHADALFAVAAKLLGLYLAIQTLVYVGSVVSFALMASRVEQGVGPMLLQLLGALISIGFGAMLIFRTERLARILRVPEVNGGIHIGSAAALRTGIILLGLYILVRDLWPLLGRASFYFGDVQGSEIMMITRISAELVPLIVAAVMVFKPDSIVALIGKGSP